MSQRSKQPNLFRITLSDANAAWVRSEAERRGVAGLRDAYSLIINEAIAAARAGATLPALPLKIQPAPAAEEDDLFTFDESKM
jgi:hypothetical protein